MEHTHAERRSKPEPRTRHGEAAKQSAVPMLPQLGLHDRLGNRALAALVQRGALRPKLQVSSAADPAEREADRIAAAVTAMSLPPVQRKCACDGGPPCASCQEKLLRKGTGAPAETAADAADKAELLGGAGRPLDGATRAFFEPRFGLDFGAVRIHDDERAARSARLLSAEAYTVGADIAFGKDRYAPGTDKGRALIAHELAHVAQRGTAAHGPVVRRLRAEDVTKMALGPNDAASLSDDDLKRAIGLLNAYEAGLPADSPERTTLASNRSRLNSEATLRGLPLTTEQEGPQTPKELASIPITFVGEEIPPEPGEGGLLGVGPSSPLLPSAGPGTPVAAAGLPGLGIGSPNLSALLAVPGLASHILAMGEHSWIGPGQAFSTMFGRQYWSSFLPRSGTMELDRILNKLPRDLYPYLQSHMQGIRVDTSNMLSMASELGLTVEDLKRAPQLIERFNAGTATAEEITLLERLAGMHVGGATADSPLVSFMRPGFDLQSVGPKRFRVRIEVPKGQALDASVPNAFNKGAAEEAEFILSLNHEGRVVSVQPMKEGKGLLQRAGAFAAKNPRLIRWGGRILVIGGLAVSGYRIATAPSEKKGRVIGEELGGLGGGALGTAAVAAGCLALGAASGGIVLFACGLFGGYLGAELGSAALGGIGEKTQRAIETMTLPEGFYEKGPPRSPTERREWDLERNQLGLPPSPLDY